MSQQNGAVKAHEVVADEIRQLIVSGELGAGDRLPTEDELTVQFGVARTTLREALRVLESQGLLAIRRGRRGGPVVTHPDLAPISMALGIALQLQGTTIGDLDDARQLIEPELAGRLAAAHTEHDLTGLDAAIAGAEDAARRDDGIAFARAAADVHTALIKSVGNRTLATFAELLQSMLLDYYTLRTDTADRALMMRATRGYRKLLRLIRAGDVEGAADHWRATMQYTIGVRDRSLPVTVSALASARVG